jgi:hypothetical protein
LLAPPPAYFPAGQAAHVPFACSTCGTKRPAAQPTQAGEPGGVAVPAGQVVHVAEAVEPWLGLDVPALHAMQVVAPAAAE